MFLFFMWFIIGGFLGWLIVNFSVFLALVVFGCCIGVGIYSIELDEKTQTKQEKVPEKKMKVL